MNPRLLTPLLLLLLLAVTMLVGCREDVVTAPPSDLPFAMYGIINPKADRQAIVVFPFQTRLRPIGPEPLDAAVRSTDLETGEVLVWRDSVLAGDHGYYDHVFWSDFRPAFGRSYRIEAVRSDGETSSVLVNVPEEVAVEVEQVGAVTVRVRFPGEGLRVINAIVRYTIGLDRYTYTFPIDYSTRVRQEDGVWTLTIRLDQYSEWLSSWWTHYYIRDVTTGTPQSSPLPPGNVLDVTIAEEAWRPPTVVLYDPFERPTFIEDMSRYDNPLFEADVMNYPDVMSNVENGFGFVGGGYRHSIEIPAATELVTLPDLD